MAFEDVLADFIVAAEPGSLGSDVVDAVVTQVADCVGVTVAGAAHPAGALVHALTQDFASRPQARLIGGGGAAAVADAAWANGCTAHLLDFDDTGFSHPTACIMPGVLAVGEWIGASGRQVVTAMAVGYEVFERLAVCARPEEHLLRQRGLHPTAVWAGPAVAAAASWLLELDCDTTRTALGLSTGAASGVSQSFGTWAKGLTAGNAARAGVMAALLASRGYRGDDNAISGPYGLFHALVGDGVYDLDVGLHGLGEGWAIADPGLSIKPYPACTSTLRAVDAMLEIAALPDYRFDAIASITIDVHPDLLHTLRYISPVDGFQGKFSLDYTVAAAALDSALTLDSFTDASAQRPELRALLARTHFRRHPEWPLSRRMETGVTVEMSDGSVVQRAVAAFRGSRGNPLRFDEIVGKFVTCVATVFSPEQSERAAQAWFELDAAPNIRGLLDSVVVETQVVSER